MLPRFDSWQSAKKAGTVAHFVPYISSRRTADSPSRSVGRHLAETDAESSMRPLSYPTMSLPPCCRMMSLSMLSTRC